MHTYDQIRAGFQAERARVKEIQHARESHADAIIRAVLKGHLGVPDDAWWYDSRISGLGVYAATSYEGDAMLVDFTVLVEGDSEADRVEVACQFGFRLWNDGDLPVAVAPGPGLRDVVVRSTDLDGTREFAELYSELLAAFVRSRDAQQYKNPDVRIWLRLG